MSDWERVDADASVPPRVGAAGRPTSSQPSLRLKRNRNPIVAAFDLGGRVFQRRLRDVTLGAIAVLVPAVALNLWVTIVATDRLDPNAETSVLFADADAGIEDVGVFVAALFVSITTALVGHFCAQLLLGERFRRPVGAVAALRTTLRRSPMVFLAWLLTHWWFVLVAAVLATASPDSVGPLLVVAVLLVWPASSATLLVVPVMVGEGLGPFRAAVRSWRLARLRFGTCLGFVLLSTVLATLFGLGITTMIPLLDQFGFLQFGDATSTIVAVAAQLAVLFVVPLVAVATAQFYVELRVTAEGLDMAIDADAAFPANRHRHRLGPRSMTGTVFAELVLVRIVPAVLQRVAGPLGPTDVDPDDIRDEACSVTAPSRICTPPTSQDFDPPDLPDADPGLASGIANLLGNLMLFLVVVALVIGLTWLISRLVRGASRAASEDDDGVESDRDESVDGLLGARVVDHDTPPREWRRLADEHAVREEYRDAVRCRYRALVGDLARAGYVDEIAGRTSGEERAQVASTVIRLARAGGVGGDVAAGEVASRSARVTTSFDRAAGTFDAAWFDDRVVSVDDHARFVADERVVLGAIASGPSNRRSRAGSVR